MWSRNALYFVVPLCLVLGASSEEAGKKEWWTDREFLSYLWPSLGYRGEVPTPDAISRYVEEKWGYDLFEVLDSYIRGSVPREFLEQEGERQAVAIEELKWVIDDRPIALLRDILEKRVVLFQEDQQNCALSSAATVVADRRFTQLYPLVEKAFVTAEDDFVIEVNFHAVWSCGGTELIPAVESMLRDNPRLQRKDPETIAWKQGMEDQLVELRQRAPGTPPPSPWPPKKETPPPPLQNPQADASPSTPDASSKPERPANPDSMNRSTSLWAAGGLLAVAILIVAAARCHRHRHRTQ